MDDLTADERLRAEVRKETLREVRDMFEQLSGPNSYAVERLDMLLAKEQKQ